MELVKRGKRTYGIYAELSSGKKVYCAFRTPGAFFLDGKPGEFRSIADALQSGKASWAIDDAQLRKAKYRGCDYIAVLVRKLEWLFMTSLETFYDPEKYYRRNYAGSGGADQRYVSVRHFQTLDRSLSLGPKTRAALKV